ncbi:MAG: carbamoyl phosphate synthase small subunit [Clostridiales bacterium]|nr:carbamoyl phosphate synthase small subunit [Clostridiales bacterium]
MQKMYVVLSDGHIFEGQGFGAAGVSLGELVFTTGMVGYIETLTDPSYYGQIVMHTFPLIGNYGMISEDMESAKSVVKGYVVREWCEMPSNFRTETDIDTFLKDNNIVAVSGVDTREITKIIREEGVMNAYITSDPSKVDLTALKSYVIKDAVKSVSTLEKSIHKAENEKYKVALMDYGAKENIVRELQARGCTVYVLPYNTKAEEILGMDIDGIMLSNGPGDPSENTEPIAELQKLLGKKPIFGICLGHQLLALAAGGKTEKLKYGHRGANQPVKRLSDGRVFITSQNHGYAVIGSSIDETKGKVSFVNANDGTCEGVEYPELNAYTVQFHPEACSGPTDTKFLFDKFLSMMGGNR